MRLSILASTLAAATLAAVSPALADTTPQALPFTQSWTTTTQIFADNDWSGVPGIIGYKGADAGTTTGGLDPRVFTAASTDTNVHANQTVTSGNSGEVAELELTDPVVGFQGSGSADYPQLVLSVITTGTANVRVQYDVRDVDGSTTDNAIQPVALQYRVGTSGAFVDVPSGYVADATTGPNEATQVTHVNVILPAEVGNQPVVEIRILTANAVGSDEFVGIDNISVGDATTPPTAVGQALPPMQIAGGAIHVMAEVTGGTLPASTGIGVTCDLTPIGGSATETLFDDGAHDDGAAGDGHFGVNTTIGAAIAAGQKTLTCTVSDAEARSSTFDVALTVLAVCGDGRVEGTEACDDDDTDAGDGCSATCTEETGYDCTGEPSVCTDIDECATQTDNCDDHATCTNTPVGSFTCTCNDGYEGSGTTCAPVCGDNQVVAGEGCDDGDTDAGDGCSATCTTEPGYSCIGSPSVCTDLNECTLNTDNCSEFATCSNTPPGSFSCTCLAGYSGNGVACAPICGDELVVTGEGCDDGGQEGGDGCSGICAVEDGWACIGMPSDCTTICGDGLVLGAEGCDDAGTDPDDGCAADCQVEDGWNCTGEPSTCSPAALCGDGTVDAGEVCDDGNDTSEDGCDATCTVEDGWVCDDAQPSVCAQDGDGDQVPDDEDNCPTVANPSQFDSDGDGIGTACDNDEGGTSDDTGCCSASHDDRSLAGFGLLALLTVFALRRRRAH